jgi:hypothetical protein
MTLIMAPDAAAVLTSANSQTRGARFALAVVLPQPTDRRSVRSRQCTRYSVR